MRSSDMLQQLSGATERVSLCESCGLASLGAIREIALHSVHPVMPAVPWG
jgi:hypothetical protein